MRSSSSRHPTPAAMRPRYAELLTEALKLFPQTPRATWTTSTAPSTSPATCSWAVEAQMREHFRSERLGNDWRPARRRGRRSAPRALVGRPGPDGRGAPVRRDGRRSSEMASVAERIREGLGCALALRRQARGMAATRSVHEHEEQVHEAEPETPRRSPSPEAPAVALAPEAPLTQAARDHAPQENGWQRRGCAPHRREIGRRRWR